MINFRGVFSELELELELDFLTTFFFFFSFFGGVFSELELELEGEGEGDFLGFFRSFMTLGSKVGSGRLGAFRDLKQTGGFIFGKSHYRSRLLSDNSEMGASS